jgi:3-hydroxyacyl-[acyl-carrier-protein] dehydratase
MSTGALALKSALRHLPHGPEFRFLDRLLTLDPGKSGAGEYKVRGDEPFLKGHFPGDPLMPGVLLIEACAQLAGVIAQSDPAIAPLANMKLTAVRGAKILGTARTGETIRLEAEITGRMAGLVQARATASLGDNANGTVILNVDVTLSGEGQETSNFNPQNS